MLEEEDEEEDNDEDNEDDEDEEDEEDEEDDEDVDECWVEETSGQEVGVDDGGVRCGGHGFGEEALESVKVGLPCLLLARFTTFRFFKRGSAILINYPGGDSFGGESITSIRTQRAYSF